MLTVEQLHQNNWAFEQKINSTLAISIDYYEEYHGDDEICYFEIMVYNPQRIGYRDQEYECHHVSYDTESSDENNQKAVDTFNEMMNKYAQ